MDLYRIDDLHDLETLGLEDIFSEKAVVIVEWPDRLKLRTDWPILRIQLEHVAEDTRRISITRMIWQRIATDGEALSLRSGAGGSSPMI